MVAIVSGNSLGLSLTSLATLGQRWQSGAAATGSSGEKVYVNVATGNLVVQERDDHIVAAGQEFLAPRTYNSLGPAEDDNQDNWTNGYLKKNGSLEYSGTLNAANSTVTRTSTDGAQASYAWNAASSNYRSTAGAGAYDTLKYDSSSQTFTWTDGDTAATEQYSKLAGTNKFALVAAADVNGNTTSYTYDNNGYLTKVTFATGEAFLYAYNGNRQLTSIAALAANGTTIANKVAYEYDGTGANSRLKTVTVDLTPENTADALTYKTSYTYANGRLASITQDDGTALTIAYDAGRVSRIVDAIGQETRYSYNTTSRATTVTDALGRATVHEYDASGQLIKVTAPAVDGVSQGTSFVYDPATGDLTRIIDPMNRVTEMSYDANGNQALQRDSLGNTVTRTYDARNQVTTEAVFLVPDPDGSGSLQPSGALVTRFVYDTGNKNLLRYALSAEGRVTEYRYDARGLRLATLQYTGASYDLGGLAADAVPTLAQMGSWASAKVPLGVLRTDVSYDIRGQKDVETVWAAVNASGEGVANGGETRTKYVYDYSGQLLQTIAGYGAAAPESTLYTYDGFGRVRTLTNALTQITQTAYNAAGSTVQVTASNGMVTTSTYDKAGRLTSITQSNSGNSSITNYAYDAVGNLVMTTDPTGVRAWKLYDEAGRHVADIDGDGSLIEYVYNADNQITRTIAYATAVNTSSLFNAITGLPTLPALAAVRPVATTADSSNWRIYDTAGRLLKTIDGDGGIAEYFYDGTSRVSKTLRYATAKAIATLGNSPADFVATTHADDRVERNFYDADGLLLATLDGEGYLTQLTYNSADQLVKRFKYAAVAGASVRASGTLAELSASITVDDVHDRTDWRIYDLKGQVVGEVDAESYLTEKIYDALGNVTRTIRYADKLSTLAKGKLGATTVLDDSIRPAAAGAQVTVYTYDGLNRVLTQTDFQGTLTRYTYDSAGNLSKTESAYGSTDARTLTARYDLQGHLVGELTAEGALQLTGTQTQAQIDAVWAQWGLTHAYDGAGRRISTTDQYGYKKLFFYNVDGRLTHTISALGEVTENQYDTLGQLKALIRYGARLNSLMGFAGGLVTSSLTSAVNAIKSSSADQATTYTYTTGGRLAGETDGLGFTRSYLYTTFGEMRSRTQQLQASQFVTDTWSYDRRGLRLQSIADDVAGGITAKTISTYDAFGRVTSIKDANNNTRTTEYDRLGRTVIAKDALSAQRFTAYDAFDRVVSETDELQNVTTYAYNSGERSIEVTSPEGVKVKSYFTRLGQTLSVTDGLGSVTTYEYDTNGSLKKTTTAAGTTRENTYDRANRLVTTKDANGVSVVFEYDAVDRLLKRTVDPSSQGHVGLSLLTQYQYDALGQQILITDPNLVATQLVYDLNGQLKERRVDPSGLNLVTRYTYDGRANVLTVTSPGNTVTQYTYDKLGRRTKEQVDPSGLNLTTTWNYDGAGNATACTDPRGYVTRYVYDAENRLVFQVSAAGEVQQNAYDAAGRLIKTVGYVNTLSLSGLPLAITATQALPVVNATRDAVRHLVYDKDDRVLAEGTALGSNKFSVVKYTYDAAGRVVERLGYANAVTGWTQGVVPQAQADASDARSRTVYDKLGRAIYTVDGTGAVVANTYDNNGNLLERTSYATTVSPNVAATQAQLALAVAAVADVSHDARTRQVFDAAGRMTWSVDAAGAVIHLTYDANGNVVDKVAYAATIDPATAATDAALSAAAAAKADAAHDARLKQVFDAAGRLVWSVNGAGAVTRRDYDANSNLIQLRRYATTIATGANPTTVASSSADRITRSAYDAANRAVYSVDALGGVVKNVYDKLGNVTQRTGYKKPIAESTANTVTAIAAALVTDPANDRVQYNAYDAVGRLSYAIDALGAVVETQRDGLGNAVRTLSYAKSISTTSLTSTPSPASVRALVVSDDTQDRVVRHAYDAAGRLCYAINELGHVQESQYDALGRVRKTILYTLATSATGWLAVPGMQTWSVTAARPATDRIESFTYDAAGNLKSVTDSLSKTETYTYDALGEKLTFTNKKGDVWSYDHDTTGRLIRETSPQVMTYTLAKNAAGDLIGEASHASVALVTRLAYDALGNLKERTEAYGRPEERLTRYEYDALGHQVKTIFPQVGVYDASEDPATNGASALATRSEQQRVLSTSTVYDVFGDATTSVDQANNYGHKVYDKLGRVRYDVDAMGYLVKYSRNAFGEVYELQRYANPLGTMPSSLTLAQADSLVAALANPSDRILKTAYDRAGRVLEVTEPDAAAYDAGLAAEPVRELSTITLQASKKTVNTYNAFGDLVRTDDGNSKTDHFFDQRGLEIATLDALGYLVRQSYDAAGLVTSRTEFALAGAAPGTTVAATPPAASTSTDDRTTSYQYDQLGRKVSETRLQVEVSGHLPLQAQANGSLVVSTSQPVPPSYAPTGTARIAGLGFSSGADGSAIISWPAPSSGVNASVRWRIAGTQAWNTATDLVANSGGTQSLTLASNMPVGSYDVEVSTRNGDNLVTYQNGTLSFYAPIASQPQLSVSGVAVTLGTRDGASVLQWATPASDILSSFQFKRPGGDWESAPVTTAGSTQYIVVPPGLAAGTYTFRLDLKRFATQRSDLATSFAYDAVGNLVRTTDALNGNTYSYYDALGRVTATATPGVTSTDSAGNQVTVLPLVEYFRDAMGNVVGQASRANGAATLGLSTYTKVDAAGNTADRFDGAIFDRFGHKIQSTDAQGGSRYFSYDERGNLAKSWQAVSDGAATNTIYQVLRYDKLGRLISTKEPAAATLAGGAVGSSVTSLTYNAFGELTLRAVDSVAAEHYFYDKAGRVWKTNAGDGVERIVLHDVQGRATMEIRNTGLSGDLDVTAITDVSQLITASGGRRTVTRYDKLGRVIETQLPARLEAQGGVSVSHMTTAAAVQQVGTITSSGWTQPNKLNVSWTSLAALGPGDIKVQVSYLTQPTQYTTTIYPGGDDIQYVTTQVASQTRTLTRTLTAEAGAAGASLEWTEADLVGGIDHVTGLAVYKQDLYGVWQKLVDQSLLGDGSNSVTLAAPTDPETDVDFQILKVGTTTWTSVATVNFGSQLRFDTAGMLDGTYEYRVRLRYPGSQAFVTSAIAGSFSLVRPTLAAIAAQITSTSAGVYSWTKPQGNLVQSLRYRLAGSTDIWRMLSVADQPNGCSGVDASGLPPGTYDYELMYSSVGDLQPLAHATGQLKIDPPVGYPPIANVGFQGFADGHATIDWPNPAAGTVAVVNYKPRSASAWTDASVFVGPPDVTTGRQAFVMPADTSPDIYDVELLFLQGGVTVARSAAIVTISPGVASLATMLDVTPAYIPAYTEPAQGTPPVDGLAFQALTNGDWNLTWNMPAAGLTSKLEFRDAVTGQWINNSARIYTSGGKQRADATGTELPPGNYDIRLTLNSATGMSNLSLGVVTVYADADIPATLTLTTPPYTPAQPAQNYPVISATFSASNDGSWVLEWAKPPAGQVTTVNYRKQGTTPWLGANSKVQTTATTEKLVISPYDLAQGKWEVDVYITSNGVRTKQTLKLVTVGQTPSYAAATLQSTTPAYTPAVGTPPVPGVAWAASGSGGSTLSWTTPPAGTTAFFKVRWHDGGPWNTVTGIQTNGTTQSRYMAPADLPVGQWDLELTLVDSAGAVTALKTGLLTVSNNGVTHGLQDTTPAYTPAQNYPLITGMAFASAASDGSWSLQWDKPAAGSTTELKYRKTGTSTWLSFTSRITSPTSTTQKAAFVAADLAPGTYELDLYYVKNGSRTAQQTGNLTVTTIVPTTATMVDITPAYVAATPAVNYPIIPTQFFPYADGSWRLQWATPAAGVSAVFRYQLPNTTQWVDMSANIVTSGATQTFDVGDSMPTGVYKLDLAFMQNGARIAQAMGDLVTCEDAVAASIVAIPTGYIPPVYHPAVNYEQIPLQFTATADGGWRLRYQDAPAGSVAKAFFRLKGTTTWWTADYVTQTAGGYKEITVRPTDLAPGVYETDVYYESNGERTKQSKGEVTTYPSTPVTPTIEGNNGIYQARQYSSTGNAEPSAAISSVQSFTLSAAPWGIPGTAFILTNDGGSILQWDAPPAGTTASFKYRVWGTSTWTELVPELGNGVQKIVVPPTFPAGRFEAELRMVSGGVTTGFASGTLAVPLSSAGGTGAATITQLASSGGSPRTLRATISRTLDRWGNVLQQNDPRSASWITSYKYNANNQVIEQTQTDPDGITTGAGVAVTKIKYDALGRQMAVIDANGNANEQYWDAAGNLVSENHADGGVVTHRYSIFGEKIRTTNEIGVATTYAYDRMSRLTTASHAAVNVRHIASDSARTLVDDGMRTLGETFTYDQAGRKIRETNGANEETLYRYDLRGNIIQTTQGGVTLKRAYDAQGRKIAERDGNDYTATWAYDVFGQLKTHTDIGGAKSTYLYDQAQQLISQTNDRGVVDGVNLAQRIEYQYDSAGQLVRSTDYNTNTASEYSYDLAGNRIRERTLRGGLVNGVDQYITYQDNQLGYDALGRLRWVADGRASVEMEYDKVGNRTHIKTHVFNGDVSEDSDRYFRYDVMNRQTVADATDANGSLGMNGHSMTYDLAGNKVADTWQGRRVSLMPGTSYTVRLGDDAPTTFTSAATWRAQLGLTTETYSRDALGRITQINRDGTVVDDRFYDAAGRVVQTGAKDGLSSGYLGAVNGTNNAGNPLQGNGSEVKTHLYDASGRLTEQRVHDSQRIKKYDLKYTKADGSANFDAAGNLLGYSLLNSEGSSYQQDYSYTYLRLDGYKEAKVHGQRINGPAADTLSTYDANGFLQKVVDTGQAANTRSYVTDAAGMVLYAEQNGHIQRQLIANGEVLGRYGEVVNDKEPRKADGTPVFTTLADFAFGASATGGNTPVIQDSIHTVSAGDTLQSIAKGAYGDSQLWYRIAEANGLNGNESLRAGQVLKVPGVEPSANSANTFKPYDPSKVVGDTSPTLPQPQADGGGCGGVGKIIMVVVAVVVAVMTQQYYILGEFGTPAAVAAVAEATLPELVISGAVGGAVGSVASQVVGNALGVQDGFSWKQVGLSALSAGMAPGLAQAGLAVTGLGTVGNAIVNGAIANAVTQGIGVVTGLQEKFDWRGVAASAAGAGIGQMVGEALTGGTYTEMGPNGQSVRVAADPVFGYGAAGNFAQSAITGLAAGTAAAVMRGGRISVQQVATDAFGNALGSSLAEANWGGGSQQGAGNSLSEEDWQHLGNELGLRDNAGRGIDNMDLVAAGDGFTMGKKISVTERGRTAYIDADDLSGLSDIELTDRAKALVGGSGSGGRGTGGSREWNASTLYQQGLGDIREFTSPASSTARGAVSDDGWYTTSEGVVQRVDYLPSTGSGSLPTVQVTARREPGDVGFNAAVVDQQILEGSYNAFSAVGNALAGGRFADAWRYASYTPTDQARDAAIARTFPQPTADAARFQQMFASPGGTVASLFTRWLGGSQSTQDAVLAITSAAGGVAGARTGGYKQTLTAPPPMPGTYASTRRIGPPVPFDNPLLVPRGQPYAVGPYNEMRGTVPGHDAHHAGQGAAMARMVPGYDRATAPSIVIPREGHTFRGPNGIVSRDTSNINTPRDLVARDIRELRRVYPQIPSDQLSELIRQNKVAYPDAFRK